MPSSPPPATTQQNGHLESQQWEESKPSWDLPNAWQQPAAYPSAIFRSTRRCLSKATQMMLLPKAVRDAGPPTERRELRPTAWLDGLRGFAAFIVYWHHHGLWAHDPETLESAWGWKDKFYFCQLPLARLFFSSGHFMVSIFFIVSGYALSVKGLSLIHAGDLEALSSNVGSSLFRRWIRLYMPVIAATFLFLTSWHLCGLKISGITPHRTWFDEVWEWYVEMKNFSFVFRGGGDPWLTYNVHMWSIPLEMRGSVIVYTVVLAVSRLARNARLLVLCGLMFYFLYVVDGWYGTLFVAGILMADLDLLAARDDLPRWVARLAPFRVFLAYHALAAALYLGGVPSHSQDLADLRISRGWYWLSFLKPQAVFDPKWYYLVHAAIFATAAIPRIPWLRRFVEGRFCQHLGRISFALYLVHGPICWTIGDRLYRAAGLGKPLIGTQHEEILWWNNKLPLPKVGPLGLEVAFLLPNIILLPLTLWVAEIATRLIDEPSVRFASWLHKKMLGPPVTR